MARSLRGRMRSLRRLGDVLRERSGASAAAGASALYQIASNRFRMATDFGTNDSAFASSDGTGRSGGNGTTLFKYGYRSFKFRTAWTAKSGRWFWFNRALTVNAMLNALFQITWQRVEVRQASNDALVAVVKWNGAGSITIGANDIVLNDPLPVDLDPTKQYYLDCWFTAPEHASWASINPGLLPGEVSATHATNDLSLAARPTSGQASIVGGTPCPGPFIALGAPADAVNVVILGDSISDLTSVAPKLTPGTGDWGYGEQAYGDDATGRFNVFAATRYSSNLFSLTDDNLNQQGGQNLIDFLSTLCLMANPNGKPLWNFLDCSHLRNNMSGGATETSIKTVVRDVFAKIRGKWPGLPIGQATCLPSATVPANGAGVPGQTQTGTGAANTAGGTIELINNWIIGGGGGPIPGTANGAPVIDVPMDVASVARNSANYTEWRTDSRTGTVKVAISAASVNTLTTDLNADIGDALIIGAGTTAFDVGAPNYVVGAKVDNGDGTFTYTGISQGRGASGVSNAANGNGRWSKAHAVGEAVNVILTSDVGGGSAAPLVHPSHATSMKMRDVKIAAKPSIKQKANAYMATLLAA